MKEDLALITSENTNNSHKPRIQYLVLLPLQPNLHPVSQIKRNILLCWTIAVCWLLPKSKDGLIS